MSLVPPLLAAVLAGVFTLHLGLASTGAESVAPLMYSTSAAIKAKGLVLAREPRFGEKELGVRAVPFERESARLDVLAPRGLRKLGHGRNQDTTWTVRHIGDGRYAALVLADQSGGMQRHTAAYEIHHAAEARQDAGTSVTILLHHITEKNLRQKATLRMTRLGWGLAPAFIADGLFFRGPRVVTFDGLAFGPASNFAIVAAAAVRHSRVTLAVAFAVLIGAVTACCGVSRALVHEVLWNLAIISWVLIAVRLAIAFLCSDLFHVLAWLSPAIAGATFLALLFLIRGLDWR